MNERKFQSDMEAFAFAKLNSPDPEFVAAKVAIYWTYLKDIPDDLWQKAVDHCMKRGTYFPSIEELGEAAMGEHYDYNPHAGSAGSPKVPWDVQLKRVLAGATERKFVEGGERSSARRRLQDLGKSLPAPKREKSN